MNKSYFGEKGYTIYKSNLSIQQQLQIRENLTVSPYIPKGSLAPKIAFPIYRESATKFYLPKYYGIRNFGLPDIQHPNLFTRVDISFHGSLREYQHTIVDKFMNNIDNNGFGGLLEVGCGQGKTVMALYILSKLKMKTLIIVHKEFLLNQWLERIQQFLPNAKVGRIQGQIIDIDDKDIVIGMLQSLSMKEYPNTLFSSFGFTIIDETHHIGAEVFVRSLFKVTTKYMLGLSATMDRKDGLTKVFKLFIGDVVYKYIDNHQHNVLVNIYTFRTHDKEFNEDILNYQGNPQYSSMISKLSDFIPRSEFILNILTYIFNKNTDQQIIILAHNKSLLSYFYKAIINKHIANSSVGFYIGGMKEKQLKQSESKTIILATYAMAAEALDIKSLTTLIMASPKTDVTQSIGRILRTKHVQPIVIDIADTHDVFQAQLKKRMSYYKKNKYTIHYYKHLSVTDFDCLEYNIKSKTIPKCLI